MAVRKVIQGWIEALGPVFESNGVSEVLDTICGVAARQGFREIGSQEQLQRIAMESLCHWNLVKESVFQKLRQSGSQENDLLGAPLPSTCP